MLAHYFIIKVAKDSSNIYQNLLLLKWVGIISFLLGILLFTVILFKNKWLLQKNNNRTIRITELILFICFTILAATNNITYPAIIYGLVSATLLFAVFWENNTKDLFFYIDDDGIKLPATSRKRNLQWWEIQNLMLRFGMLTIDCYDNRLYQWNIKSINFDKENFQRFCTERIKKNKDKVKNDW